MKKADIKGSSGTWEGRRDIVEGYAYHFESFLRRMRLYEMSPLILKGD